MGEPFEVMTTGSAPRAELVERCLLARRRLIGSLVRALPPRSQSPLRELTLEQVDGLMRIPTDGQAEVDFLAERGLPPTAGRGLVLSLLRRGLLRREHGSEGALLLLTDRGRRWRDALNAVQRRVFAAALANLSGDQQTALSDLLGSLGGGSLYQLPLAVDAGGAVTEEVVAALVSADPARPSLDSIVDHLVMLRQGIAGILGVNLTGPLADEAGSVTLHQQEALGQMPETGMTMREFSRSLGISHGSATALVDRMVRQGLLERETDPDDRRIVRVVPTKRALVVAKAIREEQRRAVADLISRLGEDQLEVLSQLALVVADLRAEPRGGGGSPAQI